MSDRIKGGDLQLASQIIKQRADATRRTIDTIEQTKLRELKRKIEDKYGLDKAASDWTDKNAQLTSKLTKLEDERMEARKKIDAEAEAAKEKINKAHSKKVDALTAAHTKKASAVEKEISKGTKALGEIKGKVQRDVEKQAHDIKRKAAEMRANLDLEIAKLQESMTTSVLPAELQTIVKQTPDIQGLASTAGIKVPALPAPPVQ